jgi:hypothetical protein
VIHFKHTVYDLCSFQGSPCEDRNFRSDADDTETEEASFSGQEDITDLHEILEWAKVCVILYTPSVVMSGDLL